MGDEGENDDGKSRRTGLVIEPLIPDHGSAKRAFRRLI